MTLVSVIIPTHNRSGLLKQAIESVLAVQDDALELEVLVVDDGSTDDTPEVVANYPVVYLRQSGGLGAAGARNVGLNASHGEYITFLDDDDVWLPNNLAPQLQLLREHAEFGMVFAQMWFCDADLVERAGPFPADTGHIHWSKTELLSFIPHVGTIVVRREVAQKIQFDPALRRAQDWDWSLSIAQCYPVGYADVPVLLYRRPPAGGNPQWRMVRDTIRVFHRHTRVLSFPARLRLQPVLWARRGWFAWLFVQQAVENAQQHNYLLSTKVLWYAIRASPPHVAVLLARLGWAKLARPFRAHGTT